MYGRKKPQLLIGIQLPIRKAINNCETIFEKNQAVCERDVLSLRRVQCCGAHYVTQPALAE